MTITTDDAKISQALALLEQHNGDGALARRLADQSGCQIDSRQWDAAEQRRHATALEKYRREMRERAETDEHVRDYRAWEYARRYQNFGGDCTAWRNLSPAERAEYEDGAAGLPAAE